MSPIHHGWQELFVFFLDFDLLPSGFWTVTDAAFVEPFARRRSRSPQTPTAAAPAHGRSSSVPTRSMAATYRLRRGSHTAGINSNLRNRPDTSKVAIDADPSAATLTLLEKLAVDNGFDRQLPRASEWLVFASSQSPLQIWLAAPGGALFVAGLSRGNVAAALRDRHNSQRSAPGGSRGRADGQRASKDSPIGAARFQLSKTLPHELLHRFENQTAGLPCSTEAERLVVQRVGQGIFRAGLLEYWEGRCAVTSLAVPELLRASHIKPWADCGSDAERLMCSMVSCWLRTSTRPSTAALSLSPTMAWSLYPTTSLRPPEASWGWLAPNALVRWRQAIARICPGIGTTSPARRRLASQMAESLSIQSQPAYDGIAPDWTGQGFAAMRGVDLRPRRLARSDMPLNPFDASGSALGYLYQCSWALVTFLTRLDPRETLEYRNRKAR